MRTRSVLLLSIPVIAAFTGCQPSSKPAATAGVRTDPAEAKRVYDLPDTDAMGIPDARSSPGALAAGSQEYADQMSAAAARHGKGARHADRMPPADPAAAATLPPVSQTPVPSEVQFQNVQHPPVAAAAPALPDPAAAAPPVAPALPPTAIMAAAPIPSATVTVTPPRTEIAFNKDSPAVNVPLYAGLPRPLPTTDDLARRFAQQAHDFPQDMAAQLNWQMLQFLQGQPVPDMRSLSTLQSEDREVLTALLDGMTNFRNAVQADSNMLLSRKIKPWLEVSDRLRTQSELLIPTIALCTDVKGFGVYDPIEPARFEAGKEHKVIVYCEVENFSSNLDEQKRWETKLSQEVVLYTEQGGVEVWRDKTPARPIIDFSRNRRHDFFIVKMVRLPANLTLDRYLLKVTVVDQQVNRVAENTVPVQIVAQP